MMNPKILQSLFLDNPKIPGEVFAFCNSLPEYQQARQEYQQLAGEVERALDSKRYLDYEAALNQYWAVDNRAFYLFGVGLRKELLDGLYQSL